MKKKKDIRKEDTKMIEQEETVEEMAEYIKTCDPEDEKVKRAKFLISRIINERKKREEWNEEKIIISKRIEELDKIIEGGH